MKKIRITLALFSAIMTVALGAFIWIMQDASSNAMSSVLFGSLVLVVCATVAAQIIYALKGQIFEFNGRLAKNEILFAIVCFQIVMQFSFGFSIYAVNQTELQNVSFDAAYSYFIELQQSSTNNSVDGYKALDLEAGMPVYIQSVFLTDNDDTTSSEQYFRFPLKDGMLVMEKSQPYFAKQLQDFIISLIMSLVISVLLMAETVYFAIKLIDRHYSLAGSGMESPASLNNVGAKLKISASNPVDYLRQIAFLFYFSGFLCSSFIPIMALDLAGDNPGADFIAGLPFSVEAFANCAAILLTARFIRKKGWKPPYIAGIGIFIAGLFASAVSPNVLAFIASRAAVGLGYGFCWMTLRNIATLSGNRAENFAGLNSGIYAGMMCGVAFGAVLADLAGYRNVLLISAVMSLIAAAFPMALRNNISETAVTGSKEIRDLSARDIAVFAVFLVAIVIPTCVSDAFCGYLLPIYVNSLKLPTAYIGRVSLIYNLCLVYISSALLLKIVCRYIKQPLFQNIIHMLIISAALFSAAYIGGFTAMIVAGMLLGTADGFGFSVQNSYVLDTQVAIKVGVSRMLTWLSLFKKFGAMLGPPIFGLFIMNGFDGLGLMGAAFIVLSITGAVLIIILKEKEGGAKQ